jgi:hypothetical protein
MQVQTINATDPNFRGETAGRCRLFKESTESHRPIGESNSGLRWELSQNRWITGPSAARIAVYRRPPPPLLPASIGHSGSPWAYGAIPGDKFCPLLGWYAA